MLDPIDVLRELEIDRVVPKSTPRDHPLTFIEALAATPQRAGSLQAVRYLRRLDDQKWYGGMTPYEALDHIGMDVFHKMIREGERAQGLPPQSYLSIQMARGRLDQLRGSPVVVRGKPVFVSLRNPYSQAPQAPQVRTKPRRKALTELTEKQIAAGFGGRAAMRAMAQDSTERGKAPTGARWRKKR